MIQYAEIKPTVYIESTVVSYLTSRPSNDAVISSRQQATQQLWNEYADNFEFVVSNIVITEITQGNPYRAQERLETIVNLRTLEVNPVVDNLAQLLIDSGAVPQNFRFDAQHIAIAAVNQIEFLVSWNYKHIVNQSKHQLINSICKHAGFQPLTICTPIDLIEEIIMKEKPIPPTDPILEECYRIKEELNAQFNSMEELTAYMMEMQEREKARGRKYTPAPPPPPGAIEKMEKMLKQIKKDSE